ncbi:MAG TPA: hypothetical protein PK681_06570 [Steroidobacteraceae bacterium]|nr:hypothetical protein [Steroidobacteraceae bacterium]HQW09742.1 hypothetical protein [Steroidobacteraceae bacterium]HQX46043.1 hypothetical protein [Steroidobacteraceae bacterium]HQX79003.1 hypothetical protein [Steroidobacteraceae bacterium]HQZ80267.1 hypothetical protein [Steroidobacteraceae bacterium]
MKLLPLGMALTLLAAGTAFAGSTTAPVATASAPTSAAPAAHKSAKECMKEAEHQKLAGKARQEFVTKCKSGETTK